MIEPRSRGDTASASSTPKCSRPAAADTRSSSAQHVAWQCETRNGNGTACCDVARRVRRGAARHTTKCTCHRFLRFGVGRAIGACRRQRSYTRRPRGFVYNNCAGHTVDEPTQARHALESLHTRSVRVRQNIAACARGTNARTPSRQTPAACHTGRRGQKTAVVAVLCDGETIQRWAWQGSRARRTGSLAASGCAQPRRPFRIVGAESRRPASPGRRLSQ